MNLEKQRENFKNHIAKFTDYGNIKILDFKEPESSHYRIRFLFEEDYCRLHISGDLGELVATNYSNMTYEKFSDFVNNIGYFEGKIDCMNRKIYVYDEGQAREDILNLMDEYDVKDDFNYYVMPEDVYEKVKDEIPYKVGVLVPEKKNYRGEWYDLKSVKKSARKDRERPVSEMLLMMFR